MDAAAPAALAVAWHAHRAEHGAPPETIDALDARFDDPPRDPLGGGRYLLHRGDDGAWVFASSLTLRPFRKGGPRRPLELRVPPPAETGAPPAPAPTP